MEQDVRASDSPGTFAGLVSAALTYRYLPICVAIAAIVLTLPALRVGWILDDHLHRAFILGVPASHGLRASQMDIFGFVDGDPQRTERIMDLGVFPWWTFKEIKLAFCRPLTVLTHWLDYQLWPESPAIMHAQSLMWFGALVASMGFLYRRFMGLTWVAGLATLLWAIDDAHGMPVGYLANRGALTAPLFGVLSLIAHDRWRRDDWNGGVVVGPMLLAASLLSKETGIATCAYLVAHAVVVDSGTWRRRCLALLPYVVVVLVWRIAWTYLGYGISNTGYYVDPINEPVRFAHAALQRIPILLLGQWALPPSEVTLMLMLYKVKCLWAVAWVVVALLALPLIRLVSRDRLARFWVLGMVLSVIPACAAAPMDRLLMFVGIGAMGLLAQWFSVTFGKRKRRPQKRLRRMGSVSLGCVLITIHLIIAPIALSLRAGFPAGPRVSILKSPMYASMKYAVGGRDVVIVNGPSTIQSLYLMAAANLKGQAVPRRARILAPAKYSMVINRPDARSLVIRPENGFMASKLDRLFRSEHHPMCIGERVELTGMTVEVTDLTEDGRPAEAEFRFAVPLEAPSIVWMQLKDGVFEPFLPPPIGDAVRLRPGMAQH